MAISEIKKGKLFTDEVMHHVKNAFHFVDTDLNNRRRLFFDNAGGSFRLKKCVETYARLAATPDCPERLHDTAVYLQDIQNNGQQGFRMMLNVEGGTVYTALTASKAMFDMVRVVSDSASGSNMVTTVLEHPSSYDAMEQNARRTGRELRVAGSNKATGGIDVGEIISLIDQDTALLSVIYASNISGAKLDIEAIVSQARKIKPDLYVLVDAVQHAPHDVIDLTKTPVDGISIAPYKFFGNRGMGLAWLSDRVAALTHDKLNGKPDRYWDVGSADPAQYAMFGEIINYVCELGSYATDSAEQRSQFVAGMQMIALHERALLARLLDGTDTTIGLRKLANVDVYLDHQDLTRRDLILAINFKHLDPVAAVKEYDKRGVTVFERVNTSLYSKRMLESFGLQGAVRVSPLHCHSAGDVDEFLSITQEMAADRQL